MKNAKLAPTLASVLACTVSMAMTGCNSPAADKFAARDTTVEYYRVFDIKTDAAPQAVTKAATDGVGRNVKDAIVAAPSGVEATELPGHFKMADPTSAAPGSAVDKGPTCEGASWTAKAAPRVRGGDNMTMVACLFPYKSGYHLDMYAIFTKPEGGLLAWPRRLSGALLGTPEKFTETAMLDIVRSIRTATHAQVSLVEAKPNLPGTPWMDGADSPLAVTQTATTAGETSKP